MFAVALAERRSVACGSAVYGMLDQPTNLLITITAADSLFCLMV